MKHTPKIFNFYAWSAIISDGFDGGKFTLVDPFHEFPRFFVFIGNFLNFLVKEGMFGILDHPLEQLPVFNVLG